MLLAARLVLHVPSSVFAGRESASFPHAFIVSCVVPSPFCSDGKVHYFFVQYNVYYITAADERMAQ